MSTEQTTENVAPEKSDAEILAAELDRDDSEYVGGSVKLVSALDNIAHKFGQKVRSYLDVDRDLVTAVSLAIVTTLRCGILFQGSPDIAGASFAYKRAVGMLYARLAGDNATEAEVTTLRNRLQKRITRSSDKEGHILTQGVVDFVVKRDKVKLTSEQRKTLRTATFSSLKTEADPTVLSVVASVNELFGVGTRGRKADAPKSQFERTFVATKNTGKKNAPVDSGQGDNVVALDNVQTVRSLPTAAQSVNVTPYETLLSMFLAAFGLRGRMTAQGARFGEPRGVTADLLEDLSYMFYGIRADVMGEDLDEDSAAGYARALDRAAGTVADSGDTDGPTNEDLKAIEDLAA